MDSWTGTRQRHNICDRGCVLCTQPLILLTGAAGSDFTYTITTDDAFSGTFVADPPARVLNVALGKMSAAVLSDNLAVRTSTD